MTGLATFVQEERQEELIMHEDGQGKSMLQVSSVLSKNDEDGQAVPAQEPELQIVKCITKNPRYRELLYKTLDYCHEYRSLDELEAYIITQPEYKQSHQSPFSLINELVRNAALVYVGEDIESPSALGGEDTSQDALIKGDGELCPMSPDDTQLSSSVDSVGKVDKEDDCLPALIEGVEITEAGQAAVALLNPQQRIQACLDVDSFKKEVLLSILHLCRTPQSLSALKKHYESQGFIDTTIPLHQRTKVSYYIDRLDEAGALYWDSAWHITDDARQYLNSMQKNGQEIQES